MPDNHICGLYFTTNLSNWEIKRHYLPQVKLESHTTISPLCFTTQLKQTFNNPNKESIAEARYTFPLYDGVAVSSYTIRYGEKTLKGVVKQKEVAKQEFQAAVDRGETAGLLEALPAGTFGTTIGNVPVRTDVHVEITYCGELKHDATLDGSRYTLPTSIAPRYGAYPGEVLIANAASQGGISITVDIDMGKSAIRKAQSPSHPISVSMGATSIEGTSIAFDPSKASATLALGSTELAADFVLQLLVDGISKPQAIVEKHPDLPDRAIMATLVPRFNLEPHSPEIIFIADQSGSMSGSKNDALRAALKIFLKSLPLGVRFNICAFGNHFKFLWPISQAYNEQNMNAAITFVETFQAQCGGTEILQPVTASFDQRLKDLPLEVMLLTDGEIWGEAALFDYINTQIHEEKVDARVFALGIGSDVSHTLVEGVARAGNGFAQFVTSNEETDQKVVRMLKGALYPHTTDYSIEVHYGTDTGSEVTACDDGDDDFELVEKVDHSVKITDSAARKPSIGKKVMSFFDKDANTDEPISAKGGDRYAHLPAIETPKLLQAPSNIPPLFPFNRTSIYLLFGPDAPQHAVSAVTLRARAPQGPIELTIPIASLTFGTTVHHLAARKAVQDLEEGRGWLHDATVAAGVPVKTKYSSRFDELVERESVRLGERFQVAGKWCSFVAVEQKPGDEGRTDEAITPSGAASEARFAAAMQQRAPRRQLASMAARRVGYAVNIDRCQVVDRGDDAHKLTLRQSVPSNGDPPPRTRKRMTVDSLSESESTPFAASSVQSFGSSGNFGAHFGAAPPPTGGIFGSSNAAASAQASSMSGSSQAATPATGSLFGTHSSAVPNRASMFQEFGSGLSRGGSALFGAAPITPPHTGSSSRGGLVLCNGALSQPPYAPDPPTQTTSQSTHALQDYQMQIMLLEQQNKNRLPMVRQKQEEFAPPAAVPGSALSGSAPPLPPCAAAPAMETSTQSNHVQQDHCFQLMLLEQQNKKHLLMARQVQGDSQPPHQSAMQKHETEMAEAANMPTGFENEFGDVLDNFDFDAFLDAPGTPDPIVSASSNQQQDPITNVLHALIHFQRFDGSWEWENHLLALFGKPTYDVSFGSQAVMATALAVAFMEIKMGEKKEIWEMVVVKAKTWLAGQTGEDADEIVAKAALRL